MSPRSRLVIGVVLVVATICIALIARARRQNLHTERLANRLVTPAPPDALGAPGLSVWDPQQAARLAVSLRSKTGILPDAKVPIARKASLSSTALRAFSAYMDSTPDAYLKLKSDSGQRPNKRLDAPPLDKSWHDLRSSIANAKWDFEHVSLVDATSPTFAYQPRSPRQPGTSAFHSIVPEASPEKMIPDGAEPGVIEFEIPGEFQGTDGLPVNGKFVIAMAWSQKQKAWIVIGTSLVDVPSGRPMRVPPA